MQAAIEFGGGFIQEEQFWRTDQCGSDRSALSLTEAELPGRLATQRAQTYTHQGFTCGHFRGFAGNTSVE